MSPKTERTPKTFLIACGLTAGAITLSGCYYKDGEIGRERILQAVWERSPSTQGFINMDAVKQAFQSRQDVEKFTERVNQIYEGDNLVLLSAAESKGGFKVEAREDLDGDGKVEKSDDLLFTLSAADGKATLEGAGVNSYYKDTWTYQEEQVAKTTARTHGRSYFFLWFGRWGGYRTGSTAGLAAGRTAYRKSPAFKSQMAQNGSYHTAASKKYGEGFRKGGMSNSRTGYIAKTTASAGFGKHLARNKNTSSWGMRTKAPSGRTSFRSGSSFRGGFSSGGLGV